jgi:hypothetical protein
MRVSQAGIEPKAGRVPHRRGNRAFTLIETMIAAGAVGLFVMVCATAIVFDQVAMRKAKEHAIVMDFLSHYAENLKAVPYAYIVAGQPINSLYNGSDGAPSILIPYASNGWFSITNTSYETFDPDLLWLANRNPQMLVTLNSNYVSGAGEIDVNLRVDWDAPMQKGGRLEVQMDLFRTTGL